MVSHRSLIFHALCIINKFQVLQAHEGVTINCTWDAHSTNIPASMLTNVESMERSKF